MRINQDPFILIARDAPKGGGGPAVTPANVDAQISFLEKLNKLKQEQLRGSMLEENEVQTQLLRSKEYNRHSDRAEEVRGYAEKNQSWAAGTLIAGGALSLLFLNPAPLIIAATIAAAPAAASAGRRVEQGIAQARANSIKSGIENSVRGGSGGAGYAGASGGLSGGAGGDIDTPERKPKDRDAMAAIDGMFDRLAKDGIEITAKSTEELEELKKSMVKNGGFRDMTAAALSSEKGSDSPIAILEQSIRDTLGVNTDGRDNLGYNNLEKLNISKTDKSNRGKALSDVLKAAAANAGIDDKAKDRREFKKLERTTKRDERQQKEDAKYERSKAFKERKLDKKEAYAHNRIDAREERSEQNLRKIKAKTGIESTKVDIDIAKRRQKRQTKLENNEGKAPFWNRKNYAEQQAELDKKLEDIKSGKKDSKKASKGAKNGPKAKKVEFKEVPEEGYEYSPFSTTPPPSAPKYAGGPSPDAYTDGPSFIAYIKTNRDDAIGELNNPSGSLRAILTNMPPEQIDEVAKEAGFNDEEKKVLQNNIENEKKRVAELESEKVRTVESTETPPPGTRGVAGTVSKDTRGVDAFEEEIVFDPYGDDNARDEAVVEGRRTLSRQESSRRGGLETKLAGDAVYANLLAEDENAEVKANQQKTDELGAKAEADIQDVENIGREGQKITAKLDSDIEKQKKDISNVEGKMEDVAKESSEVNFSEMPVGEVEELAVASSEKRNNPLETPERANSKEPPVDDVARVAAKALAPEKKQKSQVQNVLQDQTVRPEGAFAASSKATSKDTDGMSK